MSTFFISSARFSLPYLVTQKALQLSSSFAFSLRRHFWTDWQKLLTNYSPIAALNAKDATH